MLTATDGTTSLAAPPRSHSRAMRRLLTLALAMLALAGWLACTASGASASVVVDNVWCVEETDEVGSDDVYMVTFRGYTTGAFENNTAVKGPGGFWDDFDTGESWSQDITIAKSDANAVYVVMLVEEDGPRDIDAAALADLKSQLDPTWKLQMLSQLSAGLDPTAEAQKAVAGQKIVARMLGFSSIEMGFPLGNDDVIDVPKRVKVFPGQITTRNFYGDGGHYQIKFKIA